MDISKFDSVLCVTSEHNINEDERRNANFVTYPGQDFGSVKGQYNTIDPSLYNDFAFGNSLRGSLNNMGRGYFAEVTDFGRWVTVKVSYNNVQTGRTSSKFFLIIFQKDGRGVIMNTSNKYRTVSGADQAASYIRSVANALKTETNNRI